jgi:hypothetical protein
MAAHGLYGMFWTHPQTGEALWLLERNGRYARKAMRRLKGEVYRMDLPGSNGAWDAPTFRVIADRIADYREDNG